MQAISIQNPQEAADANVVTNYSGQDDVPRGVVNINDSTWWLREVAAINGYPWKA